MMYIVFILQLCVYKTLLNFNTKQWTVWLNLKLSVFSTVRV